MSDNHSNEPSSAQAGAGPLWSGMRNSTLAWIIFIGAVLLLLWTRPNKGPEVLYAAYGPAGGDKVFVDGEWKGTFALEPEDVLGTPLREVRHLDAGTGYGPHSILIVTAEGDSVRGEFNVEDGSDVVFYDADKRTIQ